MNGVAAVCCVYEDHAWLGAMVQGCYSAVDRLIFMLGTRPWCGKPGDNAATLAAIQSCPDPDRKMSIVEDAWPTEAIQRNVGLELCARAGVSHCFVVDADEVYDPVVLRLMFDTAFARPQVAVWRVQWYTYWKTYRYCIDPPEAFPPVVLCQVGSARFVRNRLVAAQSMGYFSPAVGMCHHLSYARSNQDVLTKLAHFSLADRVRSDWFDNVWTRWDEHPEMENLHPVRPEQYRRAILQDPSRYPPVLRRIYDQDEMERQRRGTFGSVTDDTTYRQ
jgi:hypothetical protein